MNFKCKRCSEILKSTDFRVIKGYRLNTCTRCQQEIFRKKRENDRRRGTNSLAMRDLNIRIREYNETMLFNPIITRPWI